MIGLGAHFKLDIYSLTPIHPSFCMGVPSRLMRFDWPIGLVVGPYTNVHHSTIFQILVTSIDTDIWYLVLAYLSYFARTDIHLLGFCR